jgi:hypothetical protein
MKSDEQTLQIEITIAPAKGRKGGWRRNPAEPTVPDPPRLPRLARLMALAIKFQDMVDRGEVRDYADLARLGYVSRARITQIMNLLHLAPDIQEQLLSLAHNPAAAQPIVERHIRRVASAVDWCEQRRRWNVEERS